MELQIRPLPRRIPTWQKIALAGLGDGTCQVPQPGVPMVYPACPASATYQSGTPAASYVNTAPAPAYVAPGHVPVPACTQDTRPGGAAFSAECIAALLAAQQQNMAADDAANRKVFVDNCNRDWQMNAERYTQLGMAVPPNDCAYRGFGQTNVGSGYLPGTPQEIIDWRNANPGGGSPGPVAGGGGASTGASSGAASFAFTNLTSGDNTNFKVGDRWQIQITGVAPNLPVSMKGGRDGASGTYPMGNTDSAGRFITNGQMGQGEIGSWSEAWTVGGQQVANFRFTVSPAGSAATSTGGGQSTQTTPPISKSVFGTLPGGSISIGGTDVPWALIGGGLLVAFLMFRGGK